MFLCFSLPFSSLPIPASHPPPQLSQLAEKAKVSMMPTFAVYMGEEQMEKTAGANEGKLKDMVEKHLSKVVE